MKTFKYYHYVLLKQKKPFWAVFLLHRASILKRKLYTDHFFAKQPQLFCQLGIGSPGSYSLWFRVIPRNFPCNVSVLAIHASLTFQLTVRGTPDDRRSTFFNGFKLIVIFPQNS